MIHKYKHGELYIVLDVNSGAVHIVDELAYKVLDAFGPKGQLEEIPEVQGYSNEAVKRVIGELETLIKEGSLFTKDTYRDNPLITNRKPVIKALCLHVAHDCNIRCKYCFASQGDFQGSREMMSLDMGKKALKFLVDHSEQRRNLEVDFFGGEPLMNFDVVKELVAYGRSLEGPNNKNFRFTLTTNGVLLNDEVNDFLNKEMDNVVLSIDGNQQTNDFMRPAINGQGTYDIIVPKFKDFIKQRGEKNYYVRGTFTKFNKDFAKDVIHLADLGFHSTSVEPVVSEPGLAYTLTEEDLPVVFKEYDKLAEEMIRRNNTPAAFDFFHFNVDLAQGPCAIKRLAGCGAGSEYISVTPNGDIYPCHQFVGNESFIMGNVVDGSFDQKMSKDFTAVSVYTKKACQDCWAKFYCSGGCHANAFNFNGDINVPYELGCKMEQKRLETAIYLQATYMLGGE